MRRFAIVCVCCSCFTADLDPNRASVFACDRADESACPDEQVCVNGRCETEDDLPTLWVGFPENEQDIGLDPNVPIGGTRSITITMSGTFDLAPRAGEHLFGQAHIEVTVDGKPAGTVDRGALSGLVEFEVELDNTVGAHRIELRAIRNDGLAYDHAGALATRLFWMGDGETPLLGVVQPWPSAEFPLDATDVDVSAAVLNFALLPPMPGVAAQDRTGHVHVYYDKDIHACISDTDGCDKNYLTTIFEQGRGGSITLPDSAAGTFKLAMVLRNIDHSLFLFDATDDNVDNPEPVIDEIEVVRR